MYIQLAGRMDMNDKDSLLRIFPVSFRDLWGQVLERYGELEEIRLRIGKPIILKLHNGEHFLKENGVISKDNKGAHIIREKELHDLLNRICHDSVYAYEDELRQGFLTISGGHRIGIAGQAVLNENGSIRTIKHISAMNIRIAHEIRGVADLVMQHLYEEGQFCNTLILSPPGCGKTTLLRDIIRQVSDGNSLQKGMTVGVVDERSEIAGCFMGVPQNDLGIRTDVLDGCPKVHGMMMLIRAMAPEVVAIDEIGGVEDVIALRKVSACGCRLLATIHGYNMEDVKSKAYMQTLLEERFFSRFIVLEKRDGCPRIREILKKE